LPYDQPMTDIALHYLADKPVHIHTCALWEHQEWGRHGGKTLEQAVACYDHSNRHALPLTLVACMPTDQVIGMVSLWDSDCPLRPDLTPWAASLYVAPDWRGRGVGSRLFIRIHHEARRLGIARLHLMTQHSEAVYAAQGWQTFERIDGPGAMRDAVLMHIDL